VCPREDDRYLGLDKDFGFDMFARHALPWTWLIAKSKNFGFDMFAKPVLSRI